MCFCAAIQTWIWIIWITSSARKMPIVRTNNKPSTESSFRVVTVQSSDDHEVGKLAMRSSPIKLITIWIEDVKILPALQQRLYFLTLILSVNWSIFVSRFASFIKNWLCKITAPIQLRHMNLLVMSSIWPLWNKGCVASKLVLTSIMSCPTFASTISLYYAPSRKIIEKWIKALKDTARLQRHIRG